ncbi:MAG: VOC family protein [Alphaproteobacteria bacterium]|nr:VOC family protein [Alphaproteobacteria bacterium]
MPADAKPIPDGMTAVTPYIIVKGAAAAIEFYRNAFGAEEVYRQTTPDGSHIVRAEIRIDGAAVFIGDEFPDMGSAGPTTLGGSPVTLHHYVEDADAAFERAVAAGATVTMPLADMFWGDRFGRLTDPFGHHWSIASHQRDATPEEMAEAMKQFFPE